MSTGELLRLPEIVRTIILNTRDISVLKNWYETRTLFRNLLNDPALLMELARNAVGKNVILGNDGVQIPDTFASFRDYLNWHVDTFYSPYCDFTSRYDDCFFGMMNADDLDRFKLIEGEYYANQEEYEGTILNFVYCPRIAEHIIAKGPTDYNVLCIAVAQGSEDDVKRLLNDAVLDGSPDETFRLVAFLYSRPDPDDRVKDTVLDYIKDRIRNGMEPDTSQFYHSVSGISYENTRWLNDVSSYIIRLNEDVLSDVKPNEFLSLGMLKSAEYSIGNPKNLINYTLRLEMIPLDVDRSELRHFIGFILPVLTEDMIDEASMDIRDIVNECLEEYRNSSSRFTPIPLL